MMRLMVCLCVYIYKFWVECTVSGTAIFPCNDVIGQIAIGAEGDVEMDGECRGSMEEREEDEGEIF